MKHLPSPVLVSQLKDLIAQERAITVQQIEHLQELDRRKAYFDYSCNSLWAFMGQELGLHGGSAQRLLDAMRLARDEPSVKSNLLDGSLSMTNAAKVQVFRRQVKKAGRARNAGQVGKIGRAHV